VKIYSAYLFDWDGTLCDTQNIWLEATDAVLTSYNVHLSRQEVAARLGQWPRALQGIPLEHHGQAKQAIMDRAQAAAINAPLYPDVELMLSRLKAEHKKIALITTSGSEVIDLVLKHHQLVAYFDLILTGDDVSAHKPDPEGILYALQSFGVSKQDAVMIGDSDNDLGAARNADVDSILFYPESHKLLHDKIHLETFGPTRIIEEWNNL
jgi:phosphoglycolate phosphatase